MLFDIEVQLVQRVNECCSRITVYMEDYLVLNDFNSNRMLQDAVVFNLLKIGEFVSSPYFKGV